MSELINHIAIVIDDSGSMQRHTPKVPVAVQKLLDGIKDTKGQENRVSIYTFGSRTQALAFDTSVGRAKAPRDYYPKQESTAFRSALKQVVTDLGDIPTKHGDHAFLVYVITDGLDNASYDTTPQLLEKILKALPENYTIAVQVPNLSARHAVINCGVPAGNIETWDTSSDEGFAEAASSTVQSFGNYATMRSSGIRGSSSFYAPDLSNVGKTEVRRTMESLKAGVDYYVYPVRKDQRIDEFVASWTGKPYTNGSGYYELTKPEEIQGYKEIVLQDRRRGEVFAGNKGRQLLGLPSHTLKIAPGDHGQWRIFIQSTAPNRKLIGGTLMLVMK